MVTVASYGGGKNSKWAIAHWLDEGNPLHIVMFADTGNWRDVKKHSEKRATYEDVLNFQEWLMYRGVPCQIVRVTGETLEENCTRRHQLPAIAYGFKTCSLRWKIEPQERFLNRWVVTREAWKRGEKVCRLVGFHAGERHRAIPYEDDRYINRYPLVECGHDNEACEEGLRSLGLCVPPKSSCFYCPNMSEVEVLELKETEPDKLERALEMERNAELTQIAGLGRTVSWQQIVTYDESQLRLLPKVAREMPCGCYDGE